MAENSFLSLPRCCLQQFCSTQWDLWQNKINEHIIKKRRFSIVKYIKYINNVISHSCIVVGAFIVSERLRIDHFHFYQSRINRLGYLILHLFLTKTLTILRDDECVGSAVSFSAQTDETPVHWCWIDTHTHVNFIW